MTPNDLAFLAKSPFTFHCPCCLPRREVVAHVASQYPRCTLFAAGWSLGANILVNYLGEQGDDTPIEAAVSMCNPFNLTISNAGLKSGFSQIYGAQARCVLCCARGRGGGLLQGHRRCVNA